MRIDKSVFIRFCLTTMIAVSLAVAGCGNDGAEGMNGQDGADGADGMDGADGADGMDGEDGADGEPGPGDVIDISDPAIHELLSAIGKPLVVDITGVTVSSPPVMTYTVTTDRGAIVSGVGTADGEGSVGGTFSKLIATSATRSHWVSYINSLVTRQGGALNPPQWAGTEGGTVVEDPDDPGSYTFTYTTDVTDVTTPAVVSWEPTLTHRAGMEIRFSPNSLNPDNPVYDFVPGGGGVTETKNIANTALCNSCHQRSGGTAEHGSGRFTVEYCVTCHNSSTAFEHEPELGPLDGALTNVDLSHLVHGIHSAALEEFDEVEYPRHIVDCAVCHTQSEATPDGDRWKESADVLSCGGCHIGGVEVTAVDANTWLATYQYQHDPLGDGPGVPQVDGNCLTCHNTSIAGNVVDQHKNLTDPATAAFQYNILSVIKTDEGEQPEITFSVTDPTNNDAKYDVYPQAQDGPWDSEGARLAVTIAWTTEAYYNLDSGSSELFFRPSAAQPVSMEVAGANAPTEPGNNVTDNGDQTYTVTSPVEVPVGLIGGDSLAVTIEGHPWVDLGGVDVGSPPNGELDCGDVPPWRCEEIPVTGAVEPCEIRDRSGAGGASGQEDCIDEDGEGDGESRYQVVDINLCNNCHGKLALHGENRTDNINACVTCHNGNATDIAARNQGSDGICVEGTLDDEQCTLNADCGPLACTGGLNDGLACESDDDCPPDGICERAGPADGTCEPNGRSLCDGGSDDGDPCIDDTDCLGGGACERVESPIDFKRMVHEIHAGNSPLIFGFGGEVHDYSHVAYPGELSNCTGCHLEGTYYPTRDDRDFRWATTTDTAGDLADPEVDSNITANTSACGSCHTSDFAASHMVSVGGGSLDVIQFNDGSLDSDEVETCTTCHSSGNDGDVATAHGLAPF